MHLLRRRARYDEAERSLPAKSRMHCLGRLAHEYYQPLPQHFIIESKISVCIRQGYLNRNPAERGYVLMANEMYAAMRDKRREYAVPGYHPNASGFTIIGVSGVGKSTAVESVLRLYPQVIEHREYKGKPLSLTQLVYLKLDCPHNGQLGGLCYSFFEEIDRVLGTDYYDQYTLIRANQGHSIPVDVELEEKTPPDILWHGTGEKYVVSIDAQGLLPKSRLYVHLSSDKETARKVGSRHGRPVIYEIDCRQMAADGYRFFESANHVWLTKEVPVKYLKKE